MRVLGGTRGFRRFLSLAVVMAGCFGPVAAQAQGEPIGGHTMEVAIDRSASRALLHLQEGWIQWMSLFYQDRAEDAGRQVEELMANLETLGMRRLPQLSLGAVVRGVEAAHQGNYPRAEIALAAAERLDPGRPETSFGRAILAEERGQRWTAITLRNQGLRRVFSNTSYRSLWQKNLVQAVLTALLLAGGAFVALLMVRYGGGLFAALGSALSRYLPLGLHSVVAVALLLWPIALPGGLAWLLLYWSVLIWGYSSATQKIVVILIWIVAGLSPLVIEKQEDDLELLLAPPVRAMDALVEGRLYGGLFSDLGVLGSLLPDSVAVQQVFGDVHRMMGQWERSRDRYGWVLEREAENVAALVDVGNFYFRKEDYGRAIQYYQDAIAGDSGSAAAHFNLSQAYSESYLFDDHRKALAAARLADENRVGTWIREGLIDRVVSVNGGVERRNEIVRALEERFSAGSVEKVSPYWSLALPVVALFLAVAFIRLGPDAVSSEADQAAPWVHILVPGLSSAEEGRGFLGFASLLLVASLLQLLMLGRIGYDLPWGIDAGLVLPTMAGVGGLLLYFAFRVWRAMRYGGR